MRVLTGSVLLAGMLLASSCEPPESQVPKSQAPDIQAPVPAPSSGVIYTGQLGIYTVEIPPGWFEVDAGESADAAFAPPGGKAYGSIFVGVEYTRRSLEEETDYVAGGNPMQGRRRLSIGGMPCITFASTGSRGERNNDLACQIVVPLTDGARKITFFMGSASRPWEYADQTDTFWRMVNSLRWADDVIADSDATDDG
jgi:hypothetical protein